MKSFIIVIICILILLTGIILYITINDPVPDEPMLFECLTKTEPDISMVDIMRQVTTARNIDRIFRTTDYRFANAVYIKNNLWKRGSTITIAFKDGSDQQKQGIKDVIVTTFQPFVDLKYQFIDQPPANVVVSFFAEDGTTPYGNRGYTRIGARQPASDVSMRIGATGKFLVQHEFLHHHGAHHEHSNPCNNPLVLSNLGQPNFPKLDPANVYCSQWDSTSIMNYSITDSNGVHVRPASSMTPIDLAFLQLLYKNDYTPPPSLTQTWSTPVPPPTQPTHSTTATTATPKY